MSEHPELTQHGDRKQIIKTTVIPLQEPIMQTSQPLLNQPLTTSSINQQPFNTSSMSQGESHFISQQPISTGIPLQTETIRTGEFTSQMPISTGIPLQTETIRTGEFVSQMPLSQTIQTGVPIQTQTMQTGVPLQQHQPQLVKKIIDTTTIEHHVNKKEKVTDKAKKAANKILGVIPNPFSSGTTTTDQAATTGEGLLNQNKAKITTSQTTEIPIQQTQQGFINDPLLSAQPLIQGQQPQSYTTTTTKIIPASQTTQTHLDCTGHTHKTT